MDSCKVIVPQEGTFQQIFLSGSVCKVLIHFPKKGGSIPHEDRNTELQLNPRQHSLSESICNEELTNANEEMIHKANVWKQDNNSKISKDDYEISVRK